MAEEFFWPRASEAKILKLDIKQRVGKQQGLGRGWEWVKTGSCALAVGKSSNMFITSFGN